MSRDLRPTRTPLEIAASQALHRSQDAEADAVTLAAIRTCATDYERACMAMSLIRAASEHLVRHRDPVTAASFCAALAGRLVPIRPVSSARAKAESLFSEEAA